jgi:acyl-ACP thioesterase
VEAAELVDANPAAGRVFEQRLMPGIADALESNRVRLDAIARWLQDVAYADLLDSGFEETGFWIVRRMRLRVEAFPSFGEQVVLRTFCSGIGRFSAQRRTSLRGETAIADAVATWVWIDENGRPARFPGHFVDLYGESAAGRPAPVRLHHPEPPQACERIPWTFRAADIDVAGHVNNSHYWEPLEERFAGSDPERVDIEIEHRDAALPGDAFVLSEADRLWIVGEGDSVYASLLIGR